MNKNIKYIIDNEPLTIIRWGIRAHKVQLLGFMPIDLGISKNLLEVVEGDVLKVELEEPTEIDGKMQGPPPVIYCPKDITPIFFHIYRHKQNMIVCVDGIKDEKQIQCLEVLEEFTKINDSAAYFTSLAEEVNAEYYFDSFDACVATKEQITMLKALTKSSKELDKAVVMMHGDNQTMPMGDFSDVLIRPGDSLDTIEIGLEGANTAVPQDQLPEDFEVPEVQTFETDNLIVFTKSIQSPKWYKQTENITILYCYQIKGRRIERVFFDDIYQEVYDNYIISTVSFPEGLFKYEEDLTPKLQAILDSAIVIRETLKSQGDTSHLMEENFTTLENDSNRLLFTKLLTKSPPFKDKLANSYMNCFMNSPLWKEFMINGKVIKMNEELHTDLTKVYYKLNPEFTEKVLSHK